MGQARLELNGGQLKILRNDFSEEVDLFSMTVFKKQRMRKRVFKIYGRNRQGQCFTSHSILQNRGLCDFSLTSGKKKKW